MESQDRSGGAFGAGKAGLPFDPIEFIKKPQVVLRIVSWVRVTFDKNYSDFINDFCIAVKSVVGRPVLSFSFPLRFPDFDSRFLPDSEPGLLLFFACHLRTLDTSSPTICLFSSNSPSL